MWTLGGKRRCGGLQEDVGVCSARNELFYSSCKRLTDVDFLATPSGSAKTTMLPGPKVASLRHACHVTALWTKASLIFFIMTGDGCMRGVLFFSAAAVISVV